MNFGEQETKAKGPSKKGFYTIGTVGVLMGMWLFYSSNKAAPVQAKQEERLDMRSGRQKDLEPPPAPQPPKLPQAESPRPEPARQRATRPPEKSAEQKMKEKVRLAAHYAPAMVPGVGTDGRRMERASVDDGDLPREPMPGRQVVDLPSAYGNRGRNGGGNVWTNDFYQRGEGQVGVLQRATSPYVIHPGWKIPARLIDPINTDTPGQITAEVVQDVKDSVTGRHTLIPYGSKIVGSYDTRMGYGQERLPTAWDWLILPNGDRMSLGAMPGADRTGVAGLPVDVDNHLWSTAGRSLLLTMTGAAADLAMRGGMGGGGRYGLDDAFRREGGRNLDRQSQDMWGRGRHRPPTGTAESGGVFLLQVTAPMTFPGPYQDVALEGSDYAMDE